MNVHGTGYRVDESTPFLWPEYLMQAGTRDPGLANQSQSQDSAGARGKEALFFPGFTKLEAYKLTRRSAFVILRKFLDEKEANTKTKSEDREKVHEEVI